MPFHEPLVVVVLTVFRSAAACHKGRSTRAMSVQLQTRSTSRVRRAMIKKRVQNKNTQRIVNLFSKRTKTSVNCKKRRDKLLLIQSFAGPRRNVERLAVAEVN